MCCFHTTVLPVSNSTVTPDDPIELTAVLPALNSGLVEQQLMGGVSPTRKHYSKTGKAHGT
jgi:hypothetical protein